MPPILAFGSSLETLKFSVHNTFETRLVLKIFDAEFPYKLSLFRATLPTRQDGGRNRDKVYCVFDRFVLFHKSPIFTVLTIFIHISPCFSGGFAIPSSEPVFLTSITESQLQIVILPLLVALQLV